MKIARRAAWVERLPRHTAVVAIALLWTLPTAGLLISSFRRKDALLQNGWWTVFQHPFDLAQFHIGNYVDVLASQGMGQAFLNSLVISFPSSIYKPCGDCSLLYIPPFMANRRLSPAESLACTRLPRLP